MTNQVKNFSLDLDAAASSRLESFKAPNIKVGAVDIRSTAQEAARVAEEGGYEILVVQEGDRPEAIFFPGYLRDVLPRHALGQAAGVKQGMALSDIIEQIDEAGIDFHSERVNYYPVFRMCPEGHITSEDPCPRHHTSTSPYP